MKPQNAQTKSLLLMTIAELAAEFRENMEKGLSDKTISRLIDEAFYCGFDKGMSFALTAVAVRGEKNAFELTDERIHEWAEFFQTELSED